MQQRPPREILIIISTETGAGAGAGTASQEGHLSFNDGVVPMEGGGHAKWECIQVVVAVFPGRRRVVAFPPPSSKFPLRTKVAK